MTPRELKRNEVLWWENQPATSIGVVEQGRVGARTAQGLIGISFPHTVIGESAILSLEGKPSPRRATLFALEDGTLVTEYPAAQVKDAFGVGVPRLVLRTLFAQVCSNNLLVLGHHAGNAVLETALVGLIQGMGQCERQIKTLADWPAFVASFRALFELREASDRVRAALVPDAELSETSVERAAQRARSLFQSADVLELLDRFLMAEAERRTADAGASEAS